MAIYRLSADVVKRAAGRTVTAAAAYRAGVLIADTRTGLAFDYHRRRGIAHTAILAPDDAPAWMRDRAALWNATEVLERRKDAQLARDIVLALPHELTPLQRVALVEGFVTAAFVRLGMVADIAIHAPDRHGDERNHHAHVLLTMRGIEGDGFGAKVRAWNETALLEQWRAQWAEHTNHALEQAGEAARVDHRSLAAQGIERLPQPKLGIAVQAMEARGITTDRGDERREVEAINAALAAIEEHQVAPPVTAPGHGLADTAAPPPEPMTKSGAELEAELVTQQRRRGLLAAFTAAARDVWERFSDAMRPRASAWKVPRHAP
jgi:ATP-dependent exoDNAse (exonuclease V) alpha subunit